MVSNKAEEMGRVIGIVRAEAMRPGSTSYEVIYGRSEHEGRTNTAAAIAGAISYLDSYTDQLLNEGFVHVRITYEDVLDSYSVTQITERFISRDDSK